MTLRDQNPSKCLQMKCSLQVTVGHWGGGLFSVGTTNIPHIQSNSFHDPNMLPPNSKLNATGGVMMGGGGVNKQLLLNQKLSG